MITVAGTDKALSDMSESELSAIVASDTHTIRRRRWVNTSHLDYLCCRMAQCRAELAVRH